MFSFPPSVNRQTNKGKTSLAEQGHSQGEVGVCVGGRQRRGYLRFLFFIMFFFLLTEVKKKSLSRKSTKVFSCCFLLVSFVY